MQAPTIPTSNLNPSDSYPSHLHSVYHTLSFQSQTPNNIFTSNIANDPNGGYGQPDPFQSLVSHSSNHNHTAVDSMTVSTTNYDSGAFAAVQNWPMTVAVAQPQILSLYSTGGATPQNDAHLVPINSTFPALWISTATKPEQSVCRKRVLKNKTKVVQSAWCDICRIECNSKEVFDQHKLGKKHKRNMEKLLAVPTTLAKPAATIVTGNHVIGPMERPDKEKSSSSSIKAKYRAARQEDLDTKRRKIMEGGAAADSLRVCGVCNVVCNSDVVFRFHLSGQKHASMMKKHTTDAGIAAT